MDNLERLEKEEKLELEELDELIERIREEYWPKVRDKDIPRSCLDCELFKFCQRINEKLICPWVQ